MPRVAIPFAGVPDGQVHPRQFVAGDTVEGDLARVAGEQGWLEKPARSPAPKRPAKRAAAKRKAAPRAATTAAAVPRKRASAAKKSPAA